MAYVCCRREQELARCQTSECQFIHRLAGTEIESYSLMPSAVLNTYLLSCPHLLSVFMKKKSADQFQRSTIRSPVLHNQITFLTRPMVCLYIH